MSYRLNTWGRLLSYVLFALLVISCDPSCPAGTQIDGGLCRRGTAGSGNAGNLAQNATESPPSLGDGSNGVVSTGGVQGVASSAAGTSAAARNSDMAPAAN